MTIDNQMVLALVCAINFFFSLIKLQFVANMQVKVVWYFYWLVTIKNWHRIYLLHSTYENIINSRKICVSLPIILSRINSYLLLNLNVLIYQFGICSNNSFLIINHGPTLAKSRDASQNQKKNISASPLFFI